MKNKHSIMAKNLQILQKNSNKKLWFKIFTKQCMYSKKNSYNLHRR